MTRQRPVRKLAKGRPLGRPFYFALLLVALAGLVAFGLSATSVFAPATGQRPRLGDAVLPTAPAGATPLPTAPPLEASPSPSASATPSASASPTGSASPSASPTPAVIGRPLIPQRGLAIWGRVMDKEGKPIPGACVVLGRAPSCWTYTSRTGNPNDDGYFLIDLGAAGGLPGSLWEFFVHVKSYTPYAYDAYYSGTFPVNDVVRKDAQFK